MEDMNENHLAWGAMLYKPTVKETFTFTYKFHGSEHKISVDVTIPLPSAKEFAYRLMASHNIPCYIEEDLMRELNAFVSEKNYGLQVHLHKKVFSKIQTTEVRDKLTKDWADSFAAKIPVCNDNDEEASWPAMYHSLIHSPALDQLLQLEQSYAAGMKDLIQQKEDFLKHLREKQVSTMEEMVAAVGSTKTADDVNRLASQQLDEAQLQEIYWSSAISELQEKQKKDYNDWVNFVYEKTNCEESIETPRIRSYTVDSHQVVPYEVSQPQESYMEESFTIHLGHQMKTMHNIRLVCRDIVDYCQCKASTIGGALQPQRLQTAMTLYSESLSALILLVDNRFDTKIGVKKKFHTICCESTDFHFPDIDKQLCQIEETLVQRPNRTRLLRTSSLNTREKKNMKTDNLLQTGDFYITKHSNLAEVHAVFHLVSDETVSSSLANSRHPIMIGVRNIMLAAARHNIHNLVVPLLLVHEMVENLTVQWCLKRAELIFKCVKGFMMEGLCWDGQDSKTLQFVVPPGISQELFVAFSNMLPNIFRVSTPLDLSNLNNKRVF